MQDVCTLISVSGTTFDEIGQSIETTTEKTIFCEVGSISRSEWSTAGEMGYKPSLMIKIYSDEYVDESDVIYKSKKYSVYRTYRPQYGLTMELYLELKVGDDNGQ